MNERARVIAIRTLERADQDINLVLQTVEADQDPRQTRLRDRVAKCLHQARTELAEARSWLLE